jgi:hypothetical protein
VLVRVVEDASESVFTKKYEPDLFLGESIKGKEARQLPFRAPQITAGRAACNEYYVATVNLGQCAMSYLCSTG